MRGGYEPQPVAYGGGPVVASQPPAGKGYDVAYPGSEQVYTGGKMQQ